ncbi:hypothetical protein BDW02DRAFT_542175 [Decorospora gaudefroyi]|uniref:Zn(2)-C6 fungal-type domain-containing protein n=1 Tax=Decorospora gaudefroyi TaxID=184978 RepID=A0A6A5KQN8_9PLEO|nr:hypothetical protein BDW02DRAFT_542175 [Decorospora gaudefroyi]
MPNVGKPSKGCSSCRSRKIKCDQKRPSCTQCLRVGKECHGYRDMLSMMFKNENEVVAKRAEKRYEELARRRVSMPPPEAESYIPGSEASTSRSFDHKEMAHQPDMTRTQKLSVARYPSTPESILSVVMPNLEDQAQGFFIANYVAPPSLVPRGQFEWLPRLLAQPNVDAVLSYSVNAVSLAGFATAVKDPTILRKSRIAYVSALNMTNDALRVKETAVKDSTLISVILLGMYENIVYKDKRSAAAWSKHVNGACTLLYLRGIEQFRSEAGRHIFHQFYGTATLAALEMGIPFHVGMRKLYEGLQPSSNYDRQVQPWSTRLTRVMHDFISLTQDKTSDPVHMVNAASALDRELDVLKTVMPSVWRYRNVQLERDSVYHSGRVYSIYADPWIAQMWNRLRPCRLHLHRLIQENITKGCLEYDPPLFSLEQISSQMEVSERILRATTVGVIASVPQITGMVPFPTPLDAQPASASSSHDEDLSSYTLHALGTFLNPAKSPGIMHLIWPLYLSSTFDFVSYERRQWVIEILQFIALRIGSRQAIVFAEELKGLQSTAKKQTLDEVDTSELFFLTSTLI